MKSWLKCPDLWQMTSCKSGQKTASMFSWEKWSPGKHCNLKVIPRSSVSPEFCRVIHPRLISSAKHGSKPQLCIFWAWSPSKWKTHSKRCVTFTLKDSPHPSLYLASYINWTLWNSFRSWALSQITKLWCTICRTCGLDWTCHWRQAVITILCSSSFIVIRPCSIWIGVMKDWPLGSGFSTWGSWTIAPLKKRLLSRPWSN